MDVYSEAQLVKAEDDEGDQRVLIELSTGRGKDGSLDKMTHSNDYSPSMTG